MFCFQKSGRQARKSEQKCRMKSVYIMRIWAPEIN